MLNEKTIVLPPNPAGNGADPNYRLTVMVPKRRYLSYLRERWWLVTVLVALSVSGVITYETVRAERYVSYAQLYASGEVQLTLGTTISEDQMTYFGTQMELLKSPRLQTKAFDLAGVVLKPGQPNPYKFEVAQPVKTAIFQLEATGPEPLTVQRYLEALIGAYIDYKKETRRTTSEDLVESLRQEVAKREETLKAESEMFVEYQKSNNLAVLEEEGRSAGLYLADLNLQLAKLRLDRELVEIGGLPVGPRLPTNLPPASEPQQNVVGAPTDTNYFAMSTDAALKSAMVELAVLRAERAAKTNDWSDLHPGMRRLNDEIRRWEKTVVALQDLNLAQRQAELQALEKRISALQAEVPSWEAKYLGINDRLAQGLRLTNNIQRQQGYYDHLLVTIQSVDLSKNIQSERLSILQEATPGQAEKRLLGVRVLLAGLAGLMLTLGAVYGWYLLDDRFVSVQDIKEQFGEPVVGLLPQIRVRRSKPQEALLRENDPRRPYAEAYRQLRSALLYSSSNQRQPQTLLVTSASPAEGKTTLAINLGRALARSGKRVALVDVDLLGGSLDRMLGTEPKPGVLDFLRGTAAAADILHPTDVPGLDYVPAGLHPHDSEGLFVPPKLEGLIAELKAARDFVIFDGPPVLAAADAAMLVPLTDGVLMVLRPFYTRSKLVRQALDLLYQRHAKQVVMVLNRAPRDDLAGQYVYYHHYARNGKRKKHERKVEAGAAPRTGA